jgi:hypothetical protein
MKAIEDYNMALELDNQTSHSYFKRRNNHNLGMSYVVPVSNEDFLTNSKDAAKMTDKSTLDSNSNKFS